MPSPSKTLIDLEKKFWQAIVDHDTDGALELLSEPALMVSTHGAMKFDHDGYRKMAEQGSMVLTAFELSDMQVVFPNDSTAVLSYHVKQKVTPRGKEDGAVQEILQFCPHHGGSAARGRRRKENVEDVERLSIDFDHQFLLKLIGSN